MVTLTFQKLGLSPSSAFLLLAGSLAGSLINLPLFTIASGNTRDYDASFFHGLLRGRISEYTGTTIIAVNVGGCIIPALFSVYLLFHGNPGVSDALLATGVVTIISFMFSRTIPGLGVGMPILIAPVSAATVAILLNPEYSAPLAYIAGTMGVLVGADLLRLTDIGRIGAPLASIGGAGTFDGIFITGVVAVLLT